MIGHNHLKYVILCLVLSGCQTVEDAGNLFLSGFDTVKKQFSEPSQVKSENPVTTASTLKQNLDNNNSSGKSNPDDPKPIPDGKKSQIIKEYLPTPDLKPEKKVAAKKTQLKTKKAKKTTYTSSGPISQASFVDGDTIKFGGKRIRLFGIDAPELRQTCRVGKRVRQCGRISREALIGFSAGSAIKCERMDIDRYGREVARCFVGDLDLSAAMVRAGLAVAYRRFSLDYVPDENVAKAQKLGVWKGTFTLPWDWRSRQKGR